MTKWILNAVGLPGLKRRNRRAPGARDLSRFTVVGFEAEMTFTTAF